MRISAAFLAGAGAGAGAGYLAGTPGGRRHVGWVAARLKRFLGQRRPSPGAGRARAVGVSPVPAATVALSSKVVDAARAAASDPTSIVRLATPQPSDLEAGQRMPSQRSTGEANGEANGEAQGDVSGPLS